MKFTPPQLSTADESHFSYGEPLSKADRDRLFAGIEHDLMLWRRAQAGDRESFSLLASVTYFDRTQDRRIRIPADFSKFGTDLTSVPRFLTWLIPKSGAHLPAAVVHDALVADSSGPPSYTVLAGEETIDRVDADVIFRNAMLDSGVGFVRRWVAWAGVTSMSLCKRGRASWGLGMRLRYRLAVALTVLVTGYLGACATLDLADWHWCGFMDLPWMREGAMWVEVPTGLAGAVAIPALLSALWGRFWLAGLIGGVVIATLFHAVVAVAAVMGAYECAERFARANLRLFLAVAALVLATGLIGFAALLVA